MPRLTSLEHEGLRFDVRDQGPADGPVVILLHGFPQDSTSWDAVVPHLHHHGFRTLAPDQRGYSREARPREVSRYDVGVLGADVLALADAAGVETFHLAGHDWGGSVAWRLGITAPERLETLTVLSTPHPRALASAMRTSRQALKSWYIGAFQIPALPERVLAGRIGVLLRRTGLPARLADHYDARFDSAEELRGPINWYRAAIRGGGLGNTSGASEVRVPTVYLWGNQDVALGRTAAEASGQFVSGPYRFMELDAGHWLPELRSGEVAAAILEHAQG